MKFYLDFEAAQFNERIISIGCVSEYGDTFGTLVRLPKGDKVGKMVTQLTGITDEMLEDAPSADEAFKHFFDWVKLMCRGHYPKFYVYGNADKHFLERTINKMEDFEAICFALGLATSIKDYSIEIQRKFGVIFKLNTLYNLILKEEKEQKHDALDDSFMLKYVIDNIDNCQIIIPEKKKEEKVKNEQENLWENDTKIRLSAIAKSWSGCKRWKINKTVEFDDCDYYVMNDSNNRICFKDIDEATLWHILYNEKVAFTKRKSFLKVKEKIEKSIKNKVPIGKFYFYKKEKE